MNKYKQYIEGKSPTPAKQLTWPLYGAGIDSLGKNGKPVEQPIPRYASWELLMRIDAVSLCYTDVKEIDQGPNHPRLTDRDLEKNPIIPGHEINMTVVGIGADLKKDYEIGQRFTIQPDVWVDGKSIPFCFGMDGGYRQYAIIGKEILHGDAGNYLIPIPNDMTYAAGAITEAWACVEAAYRMNYRQKLAEDGSVWVVGCELSRKGYSADDLFTAAKIKEVFITNVPNDIEYEIRNICANRKIPLVSRTWSEIIDSNQTFSDILLLDSEAENASAASKKLAINGVLALFHEDKANGSIEIDLGRLHYDAIYYIGSTDRNLINAYDRTKPRAELTNGGITWILGAGGPMGRMHLQRAIEATNGPKLIVASEVTEDRFKSLNDFFMPMAIQHNKELLIVNPITEPEKYAQIIKSVMEKGGFNEIEVMITVEKVIADAANYIANNGTISLFAGLKRGICAKFDTRMIYGPKQIRFIGHSGSALDDQKAVVERVISKDLKPELSVAAIGGINQIADGIRAMKNWVYPGKIVIYPHVTDYSLSGLDELKNKDPEVYEALGKNATWTKEAESIFLELRLP